MSFVCGLCGEYAERFGRKVTTQPDLSVRVRDSHRMCPSCLKAIERSPPDSGGCDWCGDGYSHPIYYGDDHHRIGSLCNGCLAQADGDHPPNFSDELKSEVRGRDGFECATCGMPQDKHQEEFSQKLHVHHKDGDKANNEKDNLVTLCARCHGSV